MFKKTCFGPLLNVDHMFNGQLLHHFLLWEVRDENPDSINFNILEKKETFTQEYFDLIIRLWPTEEIIERDTKLCKDV